MLRAANGDYNSIEDKFHYMVARSILSARATTDVKAVIIVPCDR
jgi:hypothetical protein